MPNTSLLSNVSTSQLDQIALNMADVERLSNIGDIGIAVDYSDNMLANEMQNEFPLAMWLLNTQASRRMRAKQRDGSIDIRKDSTGKFQITLPWTVGTTPPTDTSEECCWVPFDLQKCGAQAPIDLLCLKRCEDLLENFMNDIRRFGTNDLVGNGFQNAGETVEQARTRMDLISMAWFTARNIILGTSDTATETLKKFHGLMEILEQADVIKLSAQNILAGFDSLACRLAVLGGGDYIIAVHPLTYMAIDNAVQPGQFGTLPNGWTRDGGVLRFQGIPFIQDKLVTLDMKESTGEAYLLDGRTVGAWMMTNLRPEEKYWRFSGDYNKKIAEGCAGECKYYYNAGTAFGTNANKLAVLTEIPLSANCTGTSLFGLDNIIQPTTIVSMDVKTA